MYCLIMNENYIQHSGGAVGADYEWSRQGEAFGIVARHYWHRRRTPYGNVEIEEADYEAGVQRVLEANRTLRRRPERYMDLLARNWCQVKYSDAVFAIGRIKNGVVEGGTAWAVQMALDAHKPVYLFDQVWLTCRDGLWVPCNVPVLTPNFAGIGSRDITDAGIGAISEVYRNTFGVTQSVIMPTNPNGRLGFNTL